MQKVQRFAPAFGALVATGLILTLAANPAQAQRGRRNQNGQNGGVGGGGYGGGGFGGGQRMQRPAPTLATAPVSAMVPYFNLTDEQAKKIEDLQKGARPDFGAMRSTFQNMQNNGTQPTREQMAQMRSQMQTQMAKVQSDQEAAAREIGRVLTSEQRPQIPSFLRDVELFGKATLPLELIKPLALDAAQKRKLQTIAEESDAQRQAKMREAFGQMRRQPQADPNADTPDANSQNNGQARFAAIGQAMTDVNKQIHEQVLAVLTTDQRTLVEKWDKEHPNSLSNPMNGFGGFGGRGGNGR